MEYYCNNTNYIKKWMLVFCFLYVLCVSLKNVNKKWILSNPKISIFLPIYNKAQYLHRAIQSIQMQTLKNIEIIPVNDHSKDISLEILIRMKKNDSRIKIINNNRNRGLLYSRAMGILNSKGEYIMNLDPDDQLEGQDNLEFLYNIANKSKVDIINFGFIKKRKDNGENFVLCSNYNNIQYQPKIILSQYKHYDYYIWNKLIKKEIFLKAFEQFKEKIYTQKWNYGEDEIWSSLVYKNSNSMICVKKIIYIYFSNEDSLMKNKYTLFYLQNLMYWIKMLKTIMNTTQYKKHIINRLSYLIRLFRNNKYIKDIMKNNTAIKNQYINIFKGFETNNSFSYPPLKKIIHWLQIL